MNNAAHIRIALYRLGNNLLEKKVLDMATSDGYFSWDNAPVHTSTIVQDCIAAMNIKNFSQRPNVPDLAMLLCVSEDEFRAGGGISGWISDGVIEIRLLVEKGPI
jgi:hypothetical protein